MIRSLSLVILMTAAAIPSLVAQDPVVVVEGRLDANSRVAREAVAIFNARRTWRIFGSRRIERSETHRGDVGVVDGSLRVAGIIRGDLVAINANVILSPTAEVIGDVLVLGGSVRGLGDARITGSVREYSARARVRRDGTRLVLGRAPRPTRRGQVRRSFPNDGHASIVLSTGGTYNRVEGLPIHVGPRLEWSGFDYPRARVEALAILRTAGDFESNQRDLGYTVFGEVDIAREVTFGGRVFDAVAPIEDWQLRSDEVGLATFLWHRDYRDYYFRKGAAGWVKVEPFDHPVSLTGEISRADEASVTARNPWTLYRRDDLWRTNPAIDEGTFVTLRVFAEYDSRPYRRSIGSGWYVRAEWARGKSDDVTPAVLPTTIRPAIPTDGSYEYDRVFFDVRRYERVGWAGQLSLRAVGGGIVGNEGPLPIQRRLSLGGPDPMPGFEFRQFACNRTVVDAARPALCDRIALVQVEYRGNLSFSASPWNSRARDSRRRPMRHRESHVDFADFWDWDEWLWFDGPNLVLFANAGRGWLGNDIPNNFFDGVEADVGAGFEFGSLGVYGAKALTEGEPFRLTLRVHRRF